MVKWWVKKVFSVGIIFLAMVQIGCSKYQVVQEIQVNMYHLHNSKKNKVEIIVTEQKLEVGKFYRLKSIDVIDLEKLNK